MGFHLNRKGEERSSKVKNKARGKRKELPVIFLVNVNSLAVNWARQGAGCIVSPAKR